MGDQAVSTEQKYVHIPKTNTILINSSLLFLTVQSLFIYTLMYQQNCT